MSRRSITFDDAIGVMLAKPRLETRAVAEALYQVARIGFDKRAGFSSTAEPSEHQTIKPSNCESDILAQSDNPTIQRAALRAQSE